MKDTLTPEDRAAMVSYRLERAFQTLEEAQYTADGQYYNTAINRLYYSCFYAASALLLKHHIDCSSHAGVKNQFSLHFIQTGLIDKKYGSTLRQLFDSRQSGDYADFIYCDLPLYEDYKTKAVDFVNAIKNAVDTIDFS